MISQRVGGSVAAVLATGQGHREQASVVALLALAGQERRRVSVGLRDVDFSLDDGVMRGSPRHCQSRLGEGRC